MNDRIARAQTCVEIGKQMYMDLLEMPNEHDRFATVMWLAAAVSINNSNGYEWCRNALFTSMETAPIDEIRRMTRVLNNGG